MKCLNSDACGEQKKSCQRDRVGIRRPLQTRWTEAPLQEVTFGMKPDDRGAGHAGIRGEAARRLRGGAWRHTVLAERRRRRSGHSALPLGRPRRRSLPRPPVPAVIRLCSCFYVAQDPGPWARPRRGSPFRPCLFSQCLANRWSPISACGIAE